MKEKTLKELQRQYFSPEGFAYDEFLSYNKYRMNPVSSFDYAGPSRIKNILNPEQDSCIVIIERDSGTNISLMDGEMGRGLIDKCLEKEWKPKLIVPGRSFSFNNTKAEPGEPVEIKFQFYNSFPIEKTEDNESALNLVVGEIIFAFKSFYNFDEINFTQDLLEAILKKEPAFFKIDLINEKTHMNGLFSLVPPPVAEPQQ